MSSEVNQPTPESQPKPFWAPEFRQKRLGGFNAEIEEGLWNDRDPQYQVKSEQPVHRRIAELAVQGFNRKEISSLVGLTPQAVANALRQPHARMHIVNAAKRPVQEELTEFLEAELMPSLKVLASIRDDATAKASDRISAAKEIADRRLGRPTQPFATKDKAPCEMTMAELEAEVKEILSTNGRAPETSPS
jgi:hypothetical protein